MEATWADTAHGRPLCCIAFKEMWSVAAFVHLNEAVTPMDTLSLKAQDHRAQCDMHLIMECACKLQDVGDQWPEHTVAAFEGSCSGPQMYGGTRMAWHDEEDTRCR